MVRIVDYRCKYFIVCFSLKTLRKIEACSGAKERRWRYRGLHSGKQEHIGVICFRESKWLGATELGTLVG